VTNSRMFILSVMTLYACTARYPFHRIKTYEQRLRPVAPAMVNRVALMARCSLRLCYRVLA